MEIKTDNLSDGYVLVLGHIKNKKEVCISVYIDERDVVGGIEDAYLHNLVSRAYIVLKEGMENETNHH